MTGFPLEFTPYLIGGGSDTFTLELFFSGSLLEAELTIDKVSIFLWHICAPANCEEVEEWTR